MYIDAIGSGGEAGMPEYVEDYDHYSYIELDQPPVDEGTVEPTQSPPNDYEELDTSVASTPRQSQAPHDYASLI